MVAGTVCVGGLRRGDIALKEGGLGSCIEGCGGSSRRTRSAIAGGRGREREVDGVGEEAITSLSVSIQCLTRGERMMRALTSLMSKLSPT